MIWALILLASLPSAAAAGDASCAAALVGGAPFASLGDAMSAASSTGDVLLSGVQLASPGELRVEGGALWSLALTDGGTTFATCAPPSCSGMRQESATLSEPAEAAARSRGACGGRSPVVTFASGAG